MSSKRVLEMMMVVCAVAVLSGCVVHRARQTAAVRLEVEKTEAAAQAEKAKAVAPVASARIVLDSSDAKGIEKQGEWPEGQGGNDRGDGCLFALKGKGECKLIWRPTLPRAGNYRVSIWFGGDPNSDHATDSPFTVISAKGKETFKIDQTKSSGGWKVLGVFPFEAGTSGYVELTNDANGNVVADAVQFELMR
jgi:hypothetical protein